MLRRAVRQRIREPQGGDGLALPVGAAIVRFEWPGSETQAEADLNAAGYSAGRLRFRTWIAEQATRRAAAEHGVVRAEVSTGALENFVERVWPASSAPPCCFRNYSARANGSCSLRATSSKRPRSTPCTASRQRGSLRQRWTDADVALLDECEYVLGRSPVTYKHIVVDEAQDLSPMQLRSIRRRSVNGAMTIVGDIAQSTSPWARESWADILSALDANAEVAELRDRLSGTSRNLRTCAALAPACGAGSHAAPNHSRVEARARFDFVR